MDKIEEFLKLKEEIISALIEDIKKLNGDNKYERLLGLVPLMSMYKKGQDTFSWAEVFETAKRMTKANENDPKEINRVKSIVNRRMDNLVKAKVVIKKKDATDKRKTVYTFTEEIKEIFKRVIKKLS